VNTKKLIFYAVTASILSYGWEIWTIMNQSTKLLSTDIDFWGRTARASRLLRVSILFILLFYFIHLLYLLPRAHTVNDLK
jgi:hypothetical protein